MLWAGVISRRTGKRQGVLENLVELCGQIWYPSCDLAQQYESPRCHTYVILQAVPGCMELCLVLHCSCVIDVTNCSVRAIEGK